MDIDASFENVSSNRRRATYADIEALPADVIGQIVDGQLIAMPRPANIHGFAASELLGMLFEKGLRGHGGWWFVVEPEIHLGDDVLVPDLAGWRSASRPEKDRPFFTVAPDWICETLSPSIARLDRDRKLPIYARGKVGHAWLIDPEARSLEISRRSGMEWEPVAAYSTEARVRAEPFDAVELDLGQLWS